MSATFDRALECLVELTSLELPKHLVLKHRWMIQNFLTSTNEIRELFVDLFSFISGEEIEQQDFIDFSSTMLK